MTRSIRKGDTLTIQSNRTIFLNRYNSDTERCFGVILSHDKARYRVGDLVAETATYRVYLCEDHATGQQYLLQIAKEIQHNGGLERAAFVLKGLKQTSDSFDKENAKTDPDRHLNYDRLFPGVVDSFVSDEQGKRRINILSLKDVDTIHNMVPLSNLTVRDRLRVDLQTSAWIMGRLLKLLGLTHSQGIAVRELKGSNVLIETENHFVVVFDWTSALTYPQAIPEKNRADDIAHAAKAVFVAIGGNPDTLDYPYDLDNPDEQRYIEMLRRFMRGKESNAAEAHTGFYKLVREIFGYGYRQSKLLPL